MKADVDSKTAFSQQSFTVDPVKFRAGKGGEHEPVTTDSFGVHKTCARLVDNHVDERPIPRRDSTPY